MSCGSRPAWRSSCRPCLMPHAEGGWLLDLPAARRRAADAAATGPAGGTRADAAAGQGDAVAGGRAGASRSRAGRSSGSSGSTAGVADWRATAPGRWRARGGVAAPAGAASARSARNGRGGRGKFAHRRVGRSTRAIGKPTARRSSLVGWRWPSTPNAPGSRLSSGAACRATGCGRPGRRAVRRFRT